MSYCKTKEIKPRVHVFLLLCMQTNRSSLSSFQLSPKLFPGSLIAMNHFVSVVHIGLQVGHIHHQLHDTILTMRSNFKANKQKYKQTKQPDQTLVNKPYTK